MNALHKHSCFPPSFLFSISIPPWAHLCSSCLKHPGKLHFVFNVVEFPACPGRPAGKRGLCTGWLFDLINPNLVFLERLESSNSLPLPKVTTRLEERLVKADYAHLSSLLLLNHSKGSYFRIYLKEYWFCTLTEREKNRFFYSCSLNCVIKSILFSAISTTLL